MYSMSKVFVDQVEAIAKFQYQHEDAIQRIDRFLIKVQTMEEVSQRDKDAIIETIEKMKPAIIQNLMWRAINKSL
jgi:hypothetical protein